MLDKRHQEILEARGLDVELLDRFNVRSSRRGSNWIEIPYLQRGEEVNVKYRTIAGEKRFEQEANAVKCFWNYDVITDPTLADQPLVITEGELDGLTAIQCGFVRTVSVPDGAPKEAIGGDESGTKYSYVRAAEADLKKVPIIILATDGDPQGINLMNDLALRLGKARCKFLRYPKGCKDLNQVLEKFGPKGVVECFNRARFMKVDGIFRMSDLPPVIERQVFDIGITGLAKHWLLRPGDFILVTGIPGHGKSSLVNEVGFRMADDHNEVGRVGHRWNVGIASFEQEAQIDLRRNMRTFYNRKPVKWQTAAEIENADRWIDRQFSIVVPDDDAQVTLEWILDRMHAAVIQNDCRLFIIDPVNEMDHERGDMNETDYWGFFIKSIKRAAKKLGCAVICVAHPVKLFPPKPGQPIPCPTLYDVHGSANWFNKIDVGMIVHREDGVRTLVRIAKIKYHGIIGEPGNLYGHFLRDQQRFDMEVPTDSML